MGSTRAISNIEKEHQMGEILDTKQAAVFLGLRPGTLAVWRMEGRGPSYVKLGKRVVYRRAALERFQLAHTIDPQQEPQHAA